MTTGAWIFATAVTVAAIAAPVSYAAVSQTVAIGNTTNGITASVNPEQQLLTADTSAKNVVHLYTGVTAGTCKALYTPPAGKALMITSVNYDVGSGTAGTESYVELTNAACSAFYAIGDTTQGYDVQHANYPTGLSVPSVGALASPNTGADTIEVTGYIIPAAQLPANPPARHVPAKIARKVRAARP